MGFFRKLFCKHIWVDIKKYKKWSMEWEYGEIFKCEKCGKIKLVPEKN